MDLKDLIQIIKKDIRIFWGSILVVLLVSLGYFVLRPVTFDSSLDINITRMGKQETSDYKYDNFYRLQADEKFADTLVEWLGSPSVVSEILAKMGKKNDLGLRQLSHLIKGEKYSSQLVRASFSVPDEKEAGRVALGIRLVLEEKITALNQDQKEENWFKIIVGEPTVKVKDFNPWIVALAGIILGSFMGFWVVIIRHYLR